MSRVEGQTNDECRSLIQFGLEGKRSLVLLHYDVVSDSQSLTGSPAHLLSREEGIEDSWSDLLRNPCTCVTNKDLGIFAVAARADSDGPFAISPITYYISNSVSSVGDKV